MNLDWLMNFEEKKYLNDWYPKFDKWQVDLVLKQNYLS